MKTMNMLEAREKTAPGGKYQRKSSPNWYIEKQSCSDEYIEKHGEGHDRILYHGMAPLPDCYQIDIMHTLADDWEPIEVKREGLSMDEASCLAGPRGIYGRRGKRWGMYNTMIGGDQVVIHIRSGDYLPSSTLRLEDREARDWEVVDGPTRADGDWQETPLADTKRIIYIKDLKALSRLIQATPGSSGIDRVLDLMGSIVDILIRFEEGKASPKQRHGTGTRGSSISSSEPTTWVRQSDRAKTGR
jgi:hypothetical protein